MSEEIYTVTARQLKEAVAKERERCAQIAEMHEPGDTGDFMGCGCPQDIAAKIRSGK